MKRFIAVIAMLCSMVSISSFASEIGSAQSAIKNQMKDPDSTNFKSVREITNSQGGRFVCGEVNSKNSYGGYVGFKTFAYQRGRAVIDGSFSTPDDYEFLALSGCAGPDVEKVALANKQAKIGCQISWEQITDVVLFNKSAEVSADNAIAKIKLKNPNLEPTVAANMKSQFITSVNTMKADGSFVESVKSNTNATRVIFMKECINKTSKALSGM
ncbi:TPA: hypothetical protein R4Y11_001813 [Citrobacter freundii]|uniref:hypothetical protein n=1 Tax=Citrobacter freundii complex TaxID=1344959 RepID=UPI00124C619A|nr:MULTISPECIES: hypothetical protein [Citrobacter freundii complex]MCM8102103.1 hypothetical protein [Enterobacter hormaechei]EKW7336494.1 hypothetical protein [Citrobacter freundii]MDH1796200.1 hypothetical protein [Citrobacter portucalensis]QFH75156.1 hypothetical protein FR753_10935 [Citrobacter freundii]QFH79529.1 hypothetical protein FR815_06605 [Citrobacter freundii]